MTVAEIKELVIFFREQKVMVWEIEGLKGQFHPETWEPLVMPMDKDLMSGDFTEEELYGSGI